MGGGHDDQHELLGAREGGGDGAGVWRRIPGLRAKVDVPVEVEIEFAYGASGTRVQYRIDGEASEWLETIVFDVRLETRDERVRRET